MLRYALVLTLAFGAAAGVAAAVEASAAKAQLTRILAANQTVIAKNSAFPVLGPLTFEECRKEDCSEVRS
jgi:hypothetical protein